VLTGVFGAQKPCEEFWGYSFSALTLAGERVAEWTSEERNPASETGRITLHQTSDELTARRDDHIALFKGVASDHLSGECDAGGLHLEDSTRVDRGGRKDADLNEVVRASNFL
jgi:hypothetical protein